MTDFHAEPHTMTRIDTFVSAFEEAPPAFDPLPMQRIVGADADRAVA